VAPSPSAPSGSPATLSVQLERHSAASSGSKKIRDSCTPRDEEPVTEAFSAFVTGSRFRGCRLADRRLRRERRLCPVGDHFEVHKGRSGTGRTFRISSPRSSSSQEIRTSGVLRLVRLSLRSTLPGRRQWFGASFRTSASRPIVLLLVLLQLHRRMLFVVQILYLVGRLQTGGSGLRSCDPIGPLAWCVSAPRSPPSLPDGDGVRGVTVYPAPGVRS